MYIKLIDMKVIVKSIYIEFSGNIKFLKFKIFRHSKKIRDMQKDIHFIQKQSPAINLTGLSNILLLLVFHSCANRESNPEPTD